MCDYLNGSTGDLVSKMGMGTDDYNDPTHKHAVRHLGSSQKYWHDANGNIITRISGSNTYDFVYDTKNYTVQAKKNGAVIATFVYACPERRRRDGDGNGGLRSPWSKPP